jgi:hypothetical protein
MTLLRDLRRLRDRLGHRLPPGRWSHSAKLVATVVGLFLVVTVATASLTVVALRH